MLARLAFGEMPPKHHLAHRVEGRLLWEECLTRGGFDGPYTIVYHLDRPHEHVSCVATRGFAVPPPASSTGELRGLRKRHYVTSRLPKRPGPLVDVRTPLLANADVTIGLASPTEPDPVYFSNGDSDDLYFIFEGAGLVRTPLGDLTYERDDYVFVPKGLWHRFIPRASVPQSYLSIECKRGLDIPAQWRNAHGQLRMDAPYCHRDFRAPTFVGPRDEGIRDLVVKRRDSFFGFEARRSVLDVVGWDGSVYPFAFPILNFQPRVGLVHLPPDWHGTFAAGGALICSFVPRPVDFHPEAIPCPYPHSSVDCDEVLFYVRGNFTSRRGVGPGSVSHHPAGVAHGPHPGAYEASIGTRDTSELAVMLDTYAPLFATAEADSIEDPDYESSFIAG